MLQLMAVVVVNLQPLNANRSVVGLDQSATTLTGRLKDVVGLDQRSGSLRVGLNIY